MSGGSMNYLFQLVKDAEFTIDTPERLVFSAHLGKVAEALRAIEWADSGDTEMGSEVTPILACLGEDQLRMLESEKEAYKNGY